MSRPESGDVGQLLAEQEFQPRDRRGVEIGDRAQLLLAHHAQRHQMAGMKISSSGITAGTIA
jgi:hypothetical protein